MLLDGFEDPQEIEVQQPIEQVVLQPVVLIGGYGVDNPHIFNLIKEQTPCWGRHSNREKVCKTCPLLTLCESHTVFVKEQKKEGKEDVKGSWGRLREKGFEGKIKSMGILLGVQHTLKSKSVCSLTGVKLELDETAMYVEGIGIIDVDAFDIASV
jgi:hypothetical protein